MNEKESSAVRIILLPFRMLISLGKGLFELLRWDLGLVRYFPSYKRVSSIEKMKWGSLYFICARPGKMAVYSIFLSLKDFGAPDQYRELGILTSYPDSEWYDLGDQSKADIEKLIKDKVLYKVESTKVREKMEKRGMIQYPEHWIEYITNRRFLEEGFTYPWDIKNDQMKEKIQKGELEFRDFTILPEIFIQKILTQCDPELMYNLIKDEGKALQSHFTNQLSHRASEQFEIDREIFRERDREDMEEYKRHFVRLVNSWLESGKIEII